MVYGPRWEFPLPSDPDVIVIMRPAKLPDDAEAMSKYLQDPITLDFVRLGFSPSVTSELTHFEHIGESTDTVAWMVAVREPDGSETLVGITDISQGPYWEVSRRLVSGILLSNRQWWGRGIASCTHRLRTWHAFNCMGAFAIDSNFAADNHGSGRALASVGYTEIGRRPRALLVNGRWRDQVLLSCYNPAALPVMWPSNDVPEDILAATAKTRAALTWAESILLPR